MLKGIENMQENFTMIKMTEFHSPGWRRWDMFDAKCCHWGNQKSLNTPCSPCVHFGDKNPIRRLRQIFWPNTIRIEPVDYNRSCLLFIFINRRELNMKRIDTCYLRNTIHCYLQSCVYSHENHSKSRSRSF